MKSKKLIDNFEIYVSAVLQIIMILILFVQVIGRYVFNKSFAQIEEIAIMCFILSIYFGACGATKLRRHLKITILLDNLKPKVRHCFEIFGNVVFIVFNVLMIKAFIPMVSNFFHNHTCYAATRLPKWIIYIWVPILLGVMSIRLILDSIQHVKEMKSGDAGIADNTDIDITEIHISDDIADVDIDDNTDVTDSTDNTEGEGDK